MAFPDRNDQELYIDPFDGVWQTTQIQTFTDTTWTTLLGPVPLGYIYRVSQITIYQPSVATRTAWGRMVEDNGSGTAFHFRKLSITAAKSYQYPYESIAADTWLWRTWVITMEHDDIFQLQLTASQANPQPQCKIHYQKIRQQ